MRNIRLTLAYDGSDYVGWQIQPNGPSVQAAVVQAIEKLTGENVKLIAAGRTDSGVHALGQVANFETGSNIPCEQFRPGLQNFLPDDVIVRHVAEVPDDFHATYSARKKRYRYVIHNSKITDPFLRRYAWRLSTLLDAGAMHEAAQMLLGEHDFRCFESQFPNKATSVRTIFAASVLRSAGWPVWTQTDALNIEQNALFPAREDYVSDLDNLPPRGKTRHGLSRIAVELEQQGDFVCFDVVADGFLYNMVRAIVGTLIKVGQGKWTADDVRKIIDNQDRALAGETAPPEGLYLVRVDYDERAESTSESQ